MSTTCETPSRVRQILRMERRISTPLRNQLKRNLLRSPNNNLVSWPSCDSPRVRNSHLLGLAMLSRSQVSSTDPPQSMTSSCDNNRRTKNTINCHHHLLGLQKSTRRNSAESTSSTTNSKYDDMTLTSEESSDEFPIASSGYRSVSQNELLFDCMVSGEELLFIHFSIPDNAISKAIDKQMKLLANSSVSGCRHMRICSVETPIARNKFQVKDNVPTIVAMRDGKVISRLSEFESDNARELKEWASTIELLHMMSR